MRQNKNPGKTALLVKGIAAHLDSLQTLQRTVFVFTPSGKSFYVDNGLRVPAEEFEKIHTVPLLKNQNFQNKGLDSRSNFY